MARSAPGAQVKDELLTLYLIGMPTSAASVSESLCHPATIENTMANAPSVAILRATGGHGNVKSIRVSLGVVRGLASGGQRAPTPCGDILREIHSPEAVVRIVQFPEHHSVCFSCPWSRSLLAPFGAHMSHLLRIANNCPSADDLVDGALGGALAGARGNAQIG